MSTKTVDRDSKKYGGAGDFIRALESQDWELLTTSLVGYVVMSAKLYGWNVDSSGMLTNGMAPEDIAAIAVQKVISGERSWDPVRQPKLYWVLVGVARSELNHLYQSWSNRHIKTREPSVLESRADESSGPAGEFQEKMRKNRIRDVMTLIRRELNEKPDLAEIFDMIMDGTWKSGEIAGRLGVEVKEIYNMKKRLRRFILGLSITAETF